MFDWAAALAMTVLNFFGLDPESRFGAAVYFFIDDTLKIFALLYVIIFIISLFRKQLSPEKVRSYIQNKSKWLSYGLAVFLGVVTPFCTCSSVPLFIGFVEVGIPFGVTMAFLISSPLISEIAAVLLAGTAGLEIAGVYVAAGALISMLGGYLCDRFNLGAYITDRSKAKLHELEEHQHGHGCGCSHEEGGFRSLIKYAHGFASETVKETWVYIFIGIALGAAMHGYVPEEFIADYARADNPWAVPFAAIVGAPFYGSHGAVVPIVDALLQRGVPLGTSMVVLMSVTAISLPEIMMLKKVLKWQILALFVLFLLIAFIIVGYLLNFIYG